MRIASPAACPRLLPFAVACLWVSLVAARGAGMSAVEILRRAEDVRSPDLAYAADFTIRVVATAGQVPTREASYTMLAAGKDRTMVLMSSPKELYGGALLIVDGQYWLLFSTGTTPLQLSPAQVLLGDVASGDIARANLMRNYRPALLPEEEIDGEPCHHLELTATGAQAPYPRILYWVSKTKFLPWKLEYYGQTGKLLRSVRYLDYGRGSLGVRPMRLVIESVQQRENLSTLTFSNLRRVNPAAVRFTPEGILPFRNAALAFLRSEGREARIEEILPLLRR